MATRTSERIKGQEHHAVTFTADPYQSNCTRCGGLLVRDFWQDLMDASNPFIAQRCIQCGEIIDSVILRNRSLQQQSSVVHPLHVSAHCPKMQTPSPQTS